MPSDKERAMNLVGELLTAAQNKRSAIEFAKSRCDVVRVKQMQEDAALFEAAANLLDAAHESNRWKVSP